MLAAPDNRRPRGFTLIELLVVIVILGILMAVAVPTFLAQQNKAQDSKTQQQLATAYKAIRSELPSFNNAYPSTASVVSAISQSEPELTVSSGSCNASSSDKQIVVDNVLTGPDKLSLYAKSGDGYWWNLSATATSAPVFTRLGTCQGSLATGTLTASGNEITDATRAASAQGDGRAPESSYGIWMPTTNLLADGGFEKDSLGAKPGTWQVAGSNTAIVSSDRSKFGSRSLKCTYQNGPGGDSNVGYDGTVAAVTAGATYTSAVWVWIPFSYDGDGVYLNPENGGAVFTIISRTPADLSIRDQWQQISTTWSANNSVIPGLVVRASAPGSSTRPSNGAYLYLDGAQTETSVVPTPYVDTNGTTASRGAALAQFSTTSLSASRGWFAIRVRLNFSSAQPTQINNGTVDPLVWWMSPGEGNYFWLNATTNELGFQAFAGTYSSAFLPATWNSGAIYTLLGYWTPTMIGFSLNGSSFTTAPLSSSPTGMQTTMQVGSLGSSRWCDCDIFWFAAGTGTLDNSDAAMINAWGNHDPTTQDFPAAAQAQMAWSADTATYVTGN